MLGICDPLWEFIQSPYLASMILFWMHGSMISMVAITMDRIFAIKFPMRYILISNTWSYWMISIGVIIAAVVLTVQIEVGIDSYLKIQAYALVIMVLFNIVVLSTVSVLLFLVTLKHIKCIKSQEKAASLKNSICDMGKVLSVNPKVKDANHVSNVNPCSQAKPKDVDNNSGWTAVDSIRRMSLSVKRNLQRRVSKLTMKREIKAAYLCIRMVATFAILWLPWIIERIYQLSGEPRHEEWIRIGQLMIMMNSVIDPVLFISYNKKLRHAIFKGLRLQYLFSKRVAVNNIPSIIISNQ